MSDVVSIIVPVYNVETYVEACLDSIMKQSYENLEIILVDDGSTDQSHAICQRYLYRDHRIHLVEQANQGVSQARNVGLEQAHGEWLMFVDSDDYLALDMVETLLAYAQTKHLDMVQGEHCKVYRNHTFLLPHVHKTQSLRSHEAVIKLAHKKLFQNYVWGKLYRRSLFQTIRFPIGYHFEDAYVMVQLMLEAKNIGYIAKVGYHYRLRKGSITMNMNAQKIKEMKDAFLYQRRILQDAKIHVSNQKHLWMCDAFMLFRRICYHESLPQAYVWEAIIGVNKAPSKHDVKNY